MLGDTDAETNRPAPAQAHAQAQPAHAHAQLLRELPPLLLLVLGGAGFDRRVGIMAAAIPPIVVSVHPANDAATSPNFGDDALPLLLFSQRWTHAVDGTAVEVCRAHRGQ